MLIRPSNHLRFGMLMQKHFPNCCSPNFYWYIQCFWVDVTIKRERLQETQCANMGNATTNQKTKCLFKSQFTSDGVTTYCAYVLSVYIALCIYKYCINVLLVYNLMHTYCDNLSSVHNLNIDSYCINIPTHTVLSLSLVLTYLQ